jgi:alkyldihydroxyacetonephosphate synthase
MAIPNDTIQRWGSDGHGVPVTLQEFLTDRRVGPATPRPALDLAALQIRGSRLTAADLALLPCAYDTEDVTRLRCSGGFSFTDLCRRRWPEAPIPAVDVVVMPSSHQQVRKLLDLADGKGWAIVAFGGGTSVVGGIEVSERITIGMAFWAMNSVRHLDAEAGEVVVEPGITGPELERWLRARGFTWSHLPQSWERASVGGYAATRSSGQASTGYGRSDATVTKLKVATPAADFVLGKGPASAAGPDLRQVFLGSEGAFGVLTEIGLRVRPVPEKQVYDGVLFPSFSAGSRAFRQLVQERTPADVMRLSDADESAVTMAMSGLSGWKKQAFDRYTSLRNVGGGCLAVLGWEGPSQVVTARRGHAHSVFKRYGGVNLGGLVGNAWFKGRYSGPYLRDDLLDAGYLVETLETANEWSRLAATYDSVQAALRSELGRCVIGAHLSHIYPTGASLYFTVIATLDSDPVEQWRGAKRAAMDALVASNATITHHHAVGRDHAPWLPVEIGEAGIDLLRAIKAEVDPKGIMNPGVLGLE